MPELRRSRPFRVAALVLALAPPLPLQAAFSARPNCPTASARDRLSAIRELLKLEPAASEQAAAGAVYHVYRDGTTIEDEREVVVRGDVSEP